MTEEEWLASVRNERAKLATRAAIGTIVAALIGSAAIIYMVHEEGTPVGQANLAEREKTRRANKAADVELARIKLEREQVELERDKLDAAQAAKEKP